MEVKGARKKWIRHPYLPTLPSHAVFSKLDASFYIMIFSPYAFIISTTHKRVLPEFK